MNPWDLIGWSLIVLVVGSVVLNVAARFTVAAVWYVGYLRTRAVAPVEGQAWSRRDGYTLWVSRIYENGRIGVTTREPGYNPPVSASWGEDLSEFRHRTRSGRYRLVVERTTPEPPR